MTTGALAEKLGVACRGDATRIIRNIATLESAGEHDLSWIGHPKYLPQLAKTRAAAVLAPTEAPVPPAVAHLVVPDPDVALNEILGWISPPPEQVPVGVHPSAVIDTSAEVVGAAIGPQVVVGAGSRIGPGTQLHAGVKVGAGVAIGPDCVLWQNVVVRERCRLGARVIIHANATVGADGFGYLQRDGRHLKVPQVGIVEIEDDVEIGANACIDRAKSGVTRIGRGTKIDNLVQIGHNNQIGEHCIIIAQTGVSGSCRIGAGVMIGGQVGMADHVTIGDGANVISQSGLERDIPPGAVVRGSPARDNRTELRQQIAITKLPELLERVRALTRRIERLESAADDRATG